MRYVVEKVAELKESRLICFLGNDIKCRDAFFLVSKTVDTIDFFAPIEGQLSSVEQTTPLQAEDRHIDLSNALDHLLSSGGKRIRPAISLLVGRACWLEIKIN